MHDPRPDVINLTLPQTISPSSQMLVPIERVREEIDIPKIRHQIVLNYFELSQKGIVLKGVEDISERGPTVVQRFREFSRSLEEAQFGVNTSSDLESVIREGLFEQFSELIILWQVDSKLYLELTRRLKEMAQTYEAINRQIEVSTGSRSQDYESVRKFLTDTHSVMQDVIAVDSQVSGLREGAPENGLEAIRFFGDMGMPEPVMFALQQSNQELIILEGLSVLEGLAVENAGFVLGLIAYEGEDEVLSQKIRKKSWQILTQCTLGGEDSYRLEALIAYEQLRGGVEDVLEHRTPWEKDLIDEIGESTRQSRERALSKNWTLLGQPVPSELVWRFLQGYEPFQYPGERELNLETICEALEGIYLSTMGVDEAEQKAWEKTQKEVLQRGGIYLHEPGQGIIEGIKRILGGHGSRERQEGMTILYRVATYLPKEFQRLVDELFLYQIETLDVDPHARLKATKLGLRLGEKPPAEWVYQIYDSKTHPLIGLDPTERVQHLLAGHPDKGGNAYSQLSSDIAKGRYYPEQVAQKVREDQNQRVVYEREIRQRTGQEVKIYAIAVNLADSAVTDVVFVGKYHKRQKNFFGRKRRFFYVRKDYISNPESSIIEIEEPEKFVHECYFGSMNLLVQNWLKDELLAFFERGIRSGEPLRSLGGRAVPMIVSTGPLKMLTGDIGRKAVRPIKPMQSRYLHSRVATNLMRRVLDETFRLRSMSQELEQEYEPMARKIEKLQAAVRTFDGEL